MSLEFFISSTSLFWKIQTQILKNSIIPHPKNNKFGITYSIWDGEELLLQSIQSIRNQVDYINIIWQEHSWSGELYTAEMRELLDYLKANDYIDELIEYKVNPRLNPQRNEILKRNLGLYYICKSKCDYFMTMDSDEFYLSDELSIAKQYIIDNNIQYTYCPIKEYIHSSKYQLIENLHTDYVPFFSQITLPCQLGKNKQSPYITDPSRQDKFNNKKKSYKLLDNIYMHHMTNIRADLESKYRNSSDPDKYTMQKSAIHNLLAEQKIIEVADQFDI